MNDQKLKLVFNGINGVTGAYGLEPMTFEALSEQIKAAHDNAQERRRQQKSELAKLGRMLQNDSSARIGRIVRLLAESNQADLPGGCDWQEVWAKKLAAEMADLLPADKYGEPHPRAQIEDKLRVDTVNKTVEIIQMLASKSTWKSDDAQKLEALLLRDPHSPPEYAGAEGHANRTFQHCLDIVHDKIERARNDPQFARDAINLEVWLKTLAQDLRTIPVDAMKIKANSRFHPPALLVRALEESPNRRCLDSLHRDVAAQPRDAAWHDVVDLLEEWMGRALTAGQLSPWRPLLDALDTWLKLMLRSTSRHPRGVIEGIDRTDISQAGWGVIFAWEDPASPRPVPVAHIMDALAPLLALRERQAGPLFRIYQKGNGYRPYETAQEFLQRHDASVHNPADPTKVPYYLLIVGSPEHIPFHVQYQLDVQYAVGRIDFDHVEDYARYARSVVAAETGAATRPAAATFFGVSNPGDPVTALSANHLVKPLYEHVSQRAGSHWQLDVVLEDRATKAELLRMMGGDKTPALLFAACHGMEFPKDDPHDRQRRYQGALLCQDWDGPSSGLGEIPVNCYLSGDDLSDNCDLLGLIGFFFACYSAGTPLFDEYTAAEFWKSGQTIAHQPFVAALPRAMLSCLGGGALAVVGHVERAWGTSFLGPRQREQIAHFESAIEHLLKGYPLGSAMEYFGGRYAALSTQLTHTMQSPFGRKPVTSYDLAEMWMANNDARGYIIIGDPAVRLPVDRTAEQRSAVDKLTMTD